MSVLIKNYPQDIYGTDYFRIIDFLKAHGAQGLNKNWHWARWEWLIGHTNLDKNSLPQIGIFEQDGVIIGLATHDMRLGKAYIICNPAYDYIKPEMLRYVESALSHQGETGIYIDDDDFDLIHLAQVAGYEICEDREYVLALDCSKGKLSYEISCPFSIADYSFSKDLNKYNRVIWKGFDHEGMPPLITEADVTDKPHEDPKLAVFVVAPDGEYAAHCGTWYMPDTKEAYVEPVVTVPEYRKQGLGKIAVYESINRCIEMGAQKAIVISNQQFYHRLGFEEYSVHSLWKKSVNAMI